MTRDPDLVTFAFVSIAVGWTMVYSGVKKHALELKHRRRVCPSCGRQISGAACDQH